MYMVPSTIPGAGRGIVAGRNFSLLDSLESVPTILHPVRTMDASQLKNYGFGSGYDEYSLIIVGPGNIYNHWDPHTLDRYWSDDAEPDPRNAEAPFTLFKEVDYRVKADTILEGEEMFETYGGNWFKRFDAGSQRRVSEATEAAQRMDKSDLAQYGHCITDVRVGPSNVEDAGKGLFAARDFAAGEVVTISPVLALPRDVVDDSASDSVLLNYCYSRNDSDLALFPINYAPMINHARGEGANVEMGWYDWSPAVAALSAKYHPDIVNAVQDMKLSDKLKMSAQELYSADFAPLDIAYRAKRPIKQGEELFLDYGKDWEAAWERYTAAAAAHSENSEDDTEVLEFRSYLELPESMHQPHWTTQPDTHCGMFLVPSTIPGAGRGVVAGRLFRADEWIEDAPTIVVSHYASEHSQLKNYVFGSGDTNFPLIIFGPGNIYNHRKPHTLGRFGRAEEVEKAPSQNPLPYTDSCAVLYQTLAAIGTGDEMYETYGDHWFNRFAEKKADTDAEGAAQAPRDVTEAKVAAQRMNNTDMLQHGICLTDTAVRTSTLSHAGRGLFAARAFAAGEVVTVSPVLALPKAVVDQSMHDNTVLMNYCFASPDSDLVLFPLNYGPLINHAAGEGANAAVGWYDWSPAVAALSAKYHPDTLGAAQDLKLADKLKKSAQELYSADFAPLDIAYRATRPIQAGEELFFDYGTAWQEAWAAYHEVFTQWLNQQLHTGVSMEEALASSDPAKPQFRAYLNAPEGLYQPHWRSWEERSEL
jgi:hypothetical protein